MASIYKRPADKGKKNKPWLIEYRDADGDRAYAKGFTDKGLTEQLAARLENEVMLRRRGMIDPAEERSLAIRQSPIGDHLAAFERSLDNTTPKHRKLTMTRVRRLVEASEAKILADLSAEKVEEALKEIRREEDLGHGPITTTSRRSTNSGSGWWRPNACRRIRWPESTG